jgi:hypothetical protein
MGQAVMGRLPFGWVWKIKERGRRVVGPWDEVGPSEKLG